MQAPVQLIDYRIKKLHFDLVEDSEEIEIEEAEYSIDVDYEVFSFSGDENRFKIELNIKLIPNQDAENASPHNLELILEGLFVFFEELDEKEKSYHLNISCTTMLYGAARSIIHQLTGQTNYGSISIPAVQFSKVAEKKFSGEEKK